MVIPSVVFVAELQILLVIAYHQFILTKSLITRTRVEIKASAFRKQGKGDFFSCLNVQNPCFRKIMLTFS